MARTIDSAKRVINGTWGEVWLDGEKVAECTAYQQKLAKNKEGRKFRVELDFDGATQTMTEVEPDSRTVAAQYSASGRKIKQRNHARGQLTFEELPEGKEDNPFEQDRQDAQAGGHPPAGGKPA